MQTLTHRMWSRHPMKYVSFFCTGLSCRLEYNAFSGNCSYILVMFLKSTKNICITNYVNYHMCGMRQAEAWLKHLSVYALDRVCAWARSVSIIKTYSGDCDNIVICSYMAIHENDQAFTGWAISSFWDRGWAWKARGQSPRDLGSYYSLPKLRS